MFLIKSLLSKTAAFFIFLKYQIILNVANSSSAKAVCSNISIQSSINVYDDYGDAQKYIYKIHNLFILPRNGIYIKTKFLFLSNFGSLNRFLNWSSAPLEIIKFKLFQKNNLLLDNVLHLPDTGFYHFLTEVFPSLLWHLEEKIPTQLVLHKSSSSYCLQLVDLIIHKYNVDFMQVMLVDKPYGCKSAFLHTITPSSGRPFFSDLNIIDKYLGIKPTADTTSIPNSKIFISRGRFGRRSMKNDHIISEYLDSVGFQILQLEILDIQTQISILSGASIIIAPHGAGLSHLVWARPTKVLEIFPPNFTNDCYEVICNYHHITYRRIVNDAYYELNSKLSKIETKKLISEISSLI